MGAKEAIKVGEGERSAEPERCSGKERQERFEAREGRLPFLALQWRKGTTNDLRETLSRPSRKKWELHSYKYMEISVASNLNVPGNRFYQRPQKGKQALLTP